MIADTVGYVNVARTVSDASVAGGKPSAAGGPRVAIVHDYLTQRGGAERVVLSMMKAFPDARLITSLYEPDQTFPDFAQYRVETLGLNRIAAFRKDPRRAMQLLPLAFRNAVQDVDVVVCSSSGWAHGVNAPGAVKLVYCHSPARWLYEYRDYFAGLPSPLPRLLRAALSPLRRWDVVAAASVNRYLVNSSVSQARLLRAYRRTAPVLFPPVGIAEGPLEPILGLEPGYLLMVGRARGYKNASLICSAIEQLPDERLVVVGPLPERGTESPWSDRITGLRNLSDGQMRWLYSNCAALVAASHEDFGLTPVEAFTFGRPAVVLRRGGYLDSCVDGLTGLFIEDETVEGVVDALRRFRRRTFNSDAIRAHAEQFSEQRFIVSLRDEVDRLLNALPRPEAVAQVHPPRARMSA
jgi:glycosyltransferase involved in cell wall biosynthesis